MREISEIEVQVVSGGASFFHDIGVVVGTVLAKFANAVDEAELPTTSRSVL